MDSSVTMETSINSKNTVGVTVKDVLCGRGGYCHQHPGNRLFRAMIKENKGTFEALIHEPIRKQMLVESIIKAIQHHGGRFLRKSQGHWVAISGKEAYTKVSHALRDIDVSHHSSSSSGSDSSSMTSDEGKPSSPQHSQFQKALDKKGRKTLGHQATMKVTKDTKSATNTKAELPNDESKCRGVTAANDSDDIPELVECNDSEKDHDHEHDHHRTCDTTCNNKENQKPSDSMDDIPEVISVKEGSHNKLSKNMSFLSEDDDDDNEDSLRPLDPDEFVFESAEEFSHLCVTLLEYWGQGR